MKKRFIHPLLIFFSIPLLYAGENPSKPPLPPKGTYTIASIEVADQQGEPLPPSAQAAIITIAALPIGKKVQLPTSLCFQKAVQRLAKKGYAVQIHGQKNPSHTLTLTITLLQHYPLIHAIHWKGVTPKEKETLTKLTKLRTATPFFPHQRQHIEEVIEKHFHTNGYPDALASLHTQPISGTKVTLTLHIKRKRAHYLGRIHIKGKGLLAFYEMVTQLSYCKQGRLARYNDWHQRLWQNIKYGYYLTAVRELLLPLSSPPSFQEEALKQDIQQLSLYYRSKGYLLVKITPQLHTRGNKIDVHLHITPGPLHTIDRIEWVGNALLTQAQLNKGLKLKKGQTYNPLAVKKLSQHTPHTTNIYTLYEEKIAPPLWIEATLTPTGIHEGKVELQGRIKEASPPLIKAVHIKEATGHVDTHDIQHIIAQHDIRPDGQLTHAKLSACHTTLAHCGIFDAQHIHLTPSSLHAGEVTVNCHLIATSSHTYQATASDNKLILGIQQENFSLKKLLQGKLPYGQGQKVGLRLKWNYHTNLRIGGYFTHPWLFIHGKKIEIGIEGYTGYKRGKGMASDASLLIGHQHKRTHLHTFRHKLTWNNNILRKKRAICPLQKVSWKTIYQIGATNHPSFPTQGSFFQTYIKGTQLLSTHPTYAGKRYLQLLGQYTYVTTLKDHNLIFHYTGTGGLTSQKSLGRLITGHTPSLLAKTTLIDPYLLPFRGASDLTGGRYCMTHAFELRRRFTTQPTIYGLLFLDIAATSNNLHACLGAEVRCITPFGTLSAYIAYPSLDKSPFLRFRLLTGEKLR